MPLSNWSTNILSGWNITKSNTPFADASESDSLLLAPVYDIATYTQPLIASTTLTAGQSTDFNLNSFTNLVGESVTATKAMAIVITTSGPATAICHLSPSPTNGMTWFLSCPGLVTGGVAGAADNGSGLVRIQVASTTNLSTGQRMSIAGVVGTTEANGQWLITVIDGTHFDLQGSTFANAYVSGGTITLAPALVIPAGAGFAFALDAGGTPQSVSAGAGSLRVKNAGIGSLVVKIAVLLGP